MKGFGQLTIAQLRIFSRNRQVLFFSLFFPIFLMIMLGSFLGNGNNISFTGAVIDQYQSAASRTFTEILLNSPAGGNIQQETDLEKALNDLKQGDQHVVVVIPEGYGALLASPDKEKAQIVLYYDETNQLAVQLGLPNIERAVDAISKDLTAYEPVITIEAKGVQSVELEFIDFLVPGIVAMMIMNNNLNGVAGQIASWRERGVLRRMQSTTLTASTFIAAQITARLVLNGLQAVIVLLVGNLFFGTQVNGSWLLLLGFVVIGTLAFMSIGFIIAGLAKTPESAAPIAGLISFPLLFLGGVFFPIDNMPEFLQPIVNLLPISHLTTALRQIMNVGADLTTLWTEALLLGGWMLAAFLIATRTFKWD
jgi:ABC-2 type transport system permease protein